MDDYADFCDEVFKLDKIRYVGIIDESRTFVKMRKGLENLLTRDETNESISDAILRWETRKKLSGKLGEPVYAMAVYKKVKRITIPINNKGLILVSMDPSGNHEMIIDKIMMIKDMFF